MRPAQRDRLGEHPLGHLAAIGRRAGLPEVHADTCKELADEDGHGPLPFRVTREHLQQERPEGCPRTGGVATPRCGVVPGSEERFGRRDQHAMVRGLEQIRDPRELGLGETPDPSVANAAVGKTFDQDLADGLRRSVDELEQDMTQRIIRQAEWATRHMFPGRCDVRSRVRGRG